MPGKRARGADGDTRGGLDSTRLNRLSERYARGASDGEIPGAVVIVMRDGQVLLEEAVGFSDRPAGVAMTPDTAFWLASMTKPVTSVAAMMLVEEGLIDLAAPVSRYLPSFSGVTVGQVGEDQTFGRHAPMRGPTVQDLMRHTAGLFYGEFGATPVHQAYLSASLFTTSADLAEMVDKIAVAIGA